MEKSFTLKVKFWKVMKICSIQAIISLTLCGLAVAHTNYAQVLDKKITLSLKEVSIEEALDAIEAVTDVKFFYSVDQLNIRDKISFEAIDRSLRDLLDELLTPYGIKYKVHEKRSTITLKKQHDETESDASVWDKEKLDVAASYPAATITGTVTDAATQQPMAGVNIIVKGTTRGTSTDADGKFTIDAEDNEILVFSFIGFVTYETQVSGRTVIDVEMQEDIASLEEVVVNAGYWQVNKKEQTGNIAKITAKEIGQQPIGNSIGALQGRVPGLIITQQTGVPGGGFEVRIRGQNSISNGNDPLYIIDGVPYLSGSTGVNETSALLFPAGLSPLNSINPADIESIEILKDADATAIYGSRGANGVILITTKKGEAGETKIDLNYYHGIGEITRKLDLLNTVQYREMRSEARKNDGIGDQEPDGWENDINGNWDQNRFTDWQDKLIGGTANITDAQASVSSGNENIQYILGTGYRNETSVFPGDGADQRISTRLGLINISKDNKFRTSLSVNYAVNKSDLLNQDLTTTSKNLPPNAPKIFDDNGELNWENNTWYNPFALLKRKYKSHINNLISNAVISYKLSPSLEIKTSLGYSNRSDKTISTSPLSSWRPNLRASRQSQSIFSTANFQSWIVEPQINWEKKTQWGELNFLIGSTFQHQYSEAIALTARGFSSEALLENISSASEVRVGTDHYAQYRYSSIFGRINYNFKDRYIINLTSRRDGSSRFGPNKRFANFGAVGLAWVFSNEVFVQEKFSFLTYGKLRSSYGITGNDQIGDYQFLNTYSSSGNSYQGIIGMGPTRLFSPDFAWETNKKFEVALELGIKDRIFLSGSFYLNNSSNQLLGTPLPPATGFASVISNRNAIVRNTGIELELGTTNIRTKNLTWRTSVNFTIPRNKLVEYPNLEGSSDRTRLAIGEPVNIKKLYNFLGVDPETGEYKFEDVNEDGSLTSDDRETIEYVGPYYFGGLNNSFQHKGFQLEVLFQFVRQNGYNYLYFLGAPPGSALLNQPVAVLDRWQQPGDVTDVQRYNQDYSLYRSFSNAQNSNLSTSDASFIRLKNVSLSYNIPQNWLQKVNAQNCALFIQGQNLLTISDYEGDDPENQSGSTLPPLRVVSIGINLSF